MMKIYKKCISASILAALIVILVSGALYVKNNLPDTIFVGTNSSCSLPLKVRSYESSRILKYGKLVFPFGTSVWPPLTALYIASIIEPL